MVEDQSLFEDTVHECEQMKPSDMKEDQACINADEDATQIFTESMNNALKDFKG